MVIRSRISKDIFISADKQYKLICEEGRALLKHICKTCI